MIDTTIATAIKKDIGARYISKIVAFAKRKEYKKNNGNYYHGPEFSMVLYKNRGTEKIEKIIFECWEYYMKKNETDQKKRNDLLERSRKINKRI